MAGRFSVETVFKAIDRVTRPVSRMQRRVRRFTGAATRGLRAVEKQTDRVIHGFKRFGQASTIALAAMTAAFADASVIGAEFEQTLVNAAVKFPGQIRQGTEAFKQLEDAAREVGKTTEFTASQSANALNFLAMAGFSAEQSIGALPGVIDLATVAQIDLATATDIATDSLGALGLQTGNVVEDTRQLARVNDVLAKASTSANLTVEELFEALKQAAPVGTAAGQSFETIAAMASIMANAGIKGTRAATGLKNIFLALNAPGSQAAKIMRRIGVETVNADGTIRDAVGVFEDFSAAMNKLTDSQQIQIFNEIFGRIPLASAINLTRSAGAIRTMRTELEGATGVSERMAAAMRDTTKGRFLGLLSAIEAVKIGVFALTQGPMNELLEQLTEWVRLNGELVAQGLGGVLLKIVENAPAIVGFFKDVVTGIAAIIALNIALKTVSVTLGLINVLMLANPIALGIMAAVAAVAVLSGVLDPVLDMVKALWSGLRNAFNAAQTVAQVLGFNSEDEDSDEGIMKKAARALQLISPEQRAAQAIINESRSTTAHEIKVSTDQGTSAEIIRSPRDGGLTLEPTGGA